MSLGLFAVKSFSYNETKCSVADIWNLLGMHVSADCYPGDVVYNTITATGDLRWSHF